MSISEYLKYQGLPYRFESGPDCGHSDEEMMTKGMNCQLFVHRAILDQFGIELPKEMKSKEMFEDNVLLDEIFDIAMTRRGDLFFFGTENLVDFRRLHIGIHSGEVDEQTGAPKIVHANYIDQGVGIWSLDKFSAHRRYQSLYGIRRLKTLSNSEESLLEDKSIQ